MVMLCPGSMFFAGSAMRGACSASGLSSILEPVKAASVKILFGSAAGIALEEQFSMVMAV